ncbi:hypothetical protein [Leisingera sp. McT4-56]|uniref:preATP grasp domain-containing protein n=1 Tax=Leisingera sp. McT4-56 TaxID=2881255 RepID=UPI001CF92C94|nr:hypothetical protein [Leisingera sp. McT4-56]MCB4457898.1 hypothetical protein [Leisingera sp. McT4-56]
MYSSRAGSGREAGIDAIARRLVRDEPALITSRDLWPGVRQGRGLGASVFIGDQVGIALFTPAMVGFHDHRMALLAEPGDTVVVRQRCPEFETYLSEHLGMKRVRFLEAHAADLAPVAKQCLSDPGLFKHLLEALEAAGSLTLYAYLVTGHLWHLAQALAAAAQLPVHVAGPSPRISRRVNDKLWFWDVAREIAGPDSVPPSAFAFGPAAAAGRIARLARTAAQVVVKVPDSAGAAGNIRFSAAQLEGLGIAEVRGQLERRLRATGWDGRYPVLVGVWESGVEKSPSVQMWIPHSGEGQPEVLGVFEQLVHGNEGKFAGARFASLGSETEQALKNDAIRLGAMFQRAGYFGPCSLDAVLRKSHSGADQIHWIECNGRWSGVSIPLAAAGRLLGRRPEGIVVVQENLEAEAALDLAQQCKALGDLLFRCGQSREGVILISPPHPGRASLNAMAVAGSQARAEKLMEEVFDRIRAGR